MDDSSDAGQNFAQIFVKLFIEEDTMPAKVKSLEFLLIYAESLEDSLPFSTRYFGFEKQFEIAQDGSVYGSIGEVGIWIGPGHKKSEPEGADKICRTKAMLGIESAQSLFVEFQKDGVPVLQEEPIEMQPGVFWFQFLDPSGNILEVLGA